MNLRKEFARVLEREEFVARHYKAVVFKKEKRAATVATIRDWGALRARASAIKAEVRQRLAALSQRFAGAARQRGVHVHFAKTAEEGCEHVLRIAREHGVRQICKSKSMTTEECGLNPFLERHGIQVTDTDLGERIVQLFGEPPSHIVTPAIHRSRKEIGELFAREGLCEAGEEDPTRLTLAARRALRERFLDSDLGITGANFLIAETGSVVVVENEANSLLGTSLPRVHIAFAGIEKLIPRAADLSAFLTLLAPSSTGQRLTTYTTHYSGPQPATMAERELGLGDHEMHVVLLDNGRSELIGTPAEEALACIRCGACLNVCPVYRRVGGHAYDWVYPGPIGEVLGPGLGGKDELPKASSLCRACSEVCPVGIDLATHIHEWRERLVSEGRLRTSLPPGMSWLMRQPDLWRKATWMMRRTGRVGGALMRATPWIKAFRAGTKRRLPPVPRETFRDWYDKRDPGDRRLPSLTSGSTAGAAASLPASGAAARAAASHADAGATSSGDGARASVSDAAVDLAEAAARDKARGPAELEELFAARLVEGGGELWTLDELPEGAVATAAARARLAAHGVERAAAPLSKAELNGLDCLIATARWRIAETGTVWVDFGDLESRAQILLPEALVVLVDQDALYADLAAHYRELLAHELPRCGALVTGPSKTADIEQTLVFGAHGPRRFYVVSLPQAPE